MAEVSKLKSMNKIKYLKISKQDNKKPLSDDLSSKSTFLGHLVVRIKFYQYL